MMTFTAAKKTKQISEPVVAPVAPPVPAPVAKPKRAPAKSIAAGAPTPVLQDDENEDHDMDVIEDFEED